MEMTERERRSLLSTLDLDDSLWDVQHVLGHRVNRSSKCKSIEVRVMFKNPIQEVRWIDMNSLTVQDPEPVLKYIQKHHLQDKEDFKWILRCSLNADHISRLSKALKMMTRSNKKSLSLEAKYLGTQRRCIS